MDNIQGYAEAYRDVIHEDAVRIGGAVKAPDYSFRIGGVRKFFVETKKPSVTSQGRPKLSVSGAALCLEREATPQHSHQF